MFCTAHYQGWKTQEAILANREDHKKQKKEAQRILKQVGDESEIFGTSSMKRVADRVSNHLDGDADKDNQIELWGTRIGRSLGMIFFAGLVIYLLTTYVL